MILSARSVATTVGLLLLAAGPVPARTWVVDANGGGDYQSILEACQAAAPEDTVAIVPGDYDESDGDHSYALLYQKSITLLGLGTSPEEVRARLSIRFAYCDHVTIENITFHDEYSPIWCSGGEVTIRRCRFLDNAVVSNTVTGGAVIAWEGEEPFVIEDCVFLRNRATNDQISIGGAVAYSGRALTIRRCWFEANEASQHGGAIYADTDATIEDCIFVGNVSENGAAITLGDRPKLHGCTFYANRLTDPDGAAIEIGWQQNDPIERCIIAGTINGYGVGCWGAATLECFCAWQNERGNYVGGLAVPADYGNIEADPLFCAPEAGDFHLSVGSPCLPAEHGGHLCGLIGAFDAACGATPTVETSWGRVKARFLKR